MQDREVMQDLYERLVADYNGDKAFIQKEEDRLVVRRCMNAINYKDDFITIFNDDDRYFVVFVNDIGTSKVVNYDDNMFYVENLIDIYYDLITDSFSGYRHSTLTYDDYEEIVGFVEAYIDDLKKSCEIDFEACSNEVNELLTNHGKKYRLGGK